MARKKSSNKLPALATATILSLASCQSLKELPSISQLRDGDLLFHVQPSGNAITDVTQGRDNQEIDHVAIFYRDGSGLPLVVQAVYDGVVTTPLEQLAEEGGYYLVGRVVGADRQASVAKALSYRGHPYDFVYGEGDEEVYCSELVLLSYTDREGHPLFQPIPMTFRDANGEIPAYWQQLYSQRNLSVPEGEPGSNPGELSRRKEVRILYKLTDFAKCGLQDGEQ